MAGTNFTKMQRAAIDIRNKNILVSAAAGSGKTAVLVERIIERILDEQNPIDIDRMLVMTFTKAAASQMKEKILAAINEKRIKNPQDKNLNKQYALVHNANIMTIDSFCMSVVKNHFEEIGLSPDFRMADEGEIRLLKQDVLEKVLEEHYEKAEDKFLAMTEVFSSGKTDETLEKIVVTLHGYADSYPEPMEWLRGCFKEYELGNDSAPEWTQDYVNRIKDLLLSTRKAIDNAADICSLPLGPRPYLKAVESDLKFIDDLMAFNDYSSMYEKCCEFSEYQYEKLASISYKNTNLNEKELEEAKKNKDRVMDIRKGYKDKITKVIKSRSAYSLIETLEAMSLMKDHVNALMELVVSFSDAFEKKKRDRNIVDFGDLEHMCLKILREGKDTTAAEYRDFFEEIYVDEYQDSNYIQEEILKLICKTSDENGNVFMVGDVKQSIYGFRMAKPDIFIGKYNTFSICPENIDEIDGRDVRVDLSDNFRSRKEVLDSVNSIFEKTMTKKLGGIEYDDKAALHAGKEYIKTDSDYTTELKLMISDDDVDNKEAEALIVANEIKKLMLSCKVVDKDGLARPVKYSDIVILLRTAKGWDTVFMDVLKGQGIPVFVTSTTGYFDAMEVKTLLNYLKIIDNPLQDIPLASVMMSVIGGFFEEDLAKIRGAFDKKVTLYKSMTSYVETYHDDLSKKIGGFLDKLNYYRDKAGYTAVSDILAEVIDGEYGTIVRAMPYGKKRIANLNMLIKKAIEFGKTSYKGIFHFNRYIEAIRKYDIDFGEANLSDENDNTVRIMSIHKSKGLEFPICFLPGMSKKFNMMDVRAAVLADSKYGIATDIIDIDRRVKSKSPYKTLVAMKKEEEIIAEELRLMYVAMTRAKEKLIMTGVIKDEFALIDSQVTIDKANSYLDIYRCAASEDKVENINIEYIGVTELVSEVTSREVTKEVERSGLIDFLENGLCEDGESNTGEAGLDISIIKERINYSYERNIVEAVKLSVSELKHRSNEETVDENPLAEAVTEKLYEDEKSENVESTYVKGDKNPAALHGSAVHRVFEIWDYKKEATMDSVKEFLAYIKEEKLMEAELIEMIREDEIFDFVSSDIASRMRDADSKGLLFREQPFVIADDENNPDSLMIQGIIDAYFIEDGEIVLVDYKTDRGKSAEKLIEDHKVQLEYYAKALTRMLGLKVKESVIYSTFLKKSIII